MFGAHNMDATASCRTPSALWHFFALRWYDYFGSKMFLQASSVEVSHGDSTICGNVGAWGHQRETSLSNAGDSQTPPQAFMLEWTKLEGQNCPNCNMFALLEALDNIVKYRNLKTLWNNDRSSGRLPLNLVSKCLIFYLSKINLLPYMDLLYRLNVEVNPIASFLCLGRKIYHRTSPSNNWIDRHLLIADNWCRLWYALVIWFKLRAATSCYFPRLKIQ